MKKKYIKRTYQLLLVLAAVVFLCNNVEAKRSSSGRSSSRSIGSSIWGRRKSDSHSSRRANPHKPAPATQAKPSAPVRITSI